MLNPTSVGSGKFSPGSHDCLVPVFSSALLGSQDPEPIHKRPKLQVPTASQTGLGVIHPDLLFA